ncbi:DUF2513 domain-containing protein [Vibrio scophthalmi]|uniref:DUF2513 domain-containing protein n=1 Tax=Vibrio scophthalmi LMG 19158 TaxID=870967 RepID=F9RLQ8_9VIBR|nr:DUF2513 domain-containing protein [Vibrio scophthalmi]EGU38816.1 hypothetical protein VIS19158_04851 [Vibrio scophthalmi LMG 19158]
MKKDLTVIRDILQRFADSERMYLRFNELSDRSPEELLNDDVFMGHLVWILQDGLITNSDFQCSEPKDIGLIWFANRRKYDFRMTDIRITSKGLEVLEALSKPEIFEKLKGVAGNVSFSVLTDLAKQLIAKSVAVAVGLG